MKYKTLSNNKNILILILSGQVGKWLEIPLKVDKWDDPGLNPGP
jgi:hypothetical protein